MSTRREIIKSAILLPAFPHVIATSQEAASKRSNEEFSTQVEQVRSRFDLPAFGAVITSRTGIRFFGVAGSRKSDQAGESYRVSEDSHWQLGSITKTFTGTLIAKLIDQGKLQWDSTLGDIFPEWVPKMAANVAKVTVKHLILHRSGMGGDVIGWAGSPEINVAGWTLSQRRQKFIEIATRHALLFDPGTKIQYSNQAYNTLGAISEKVTGRTFEELITTELCQPLGIKSVVFGEAALHREDREPWPHQSINGRYVPVPPVPETQYGYHACNPAGGISLTLSDMALWMQAHLNGAVSQSSSRREHLLSRANFEILHGREEDGGISPFAHVHPYPISGRTICHSGSNGRHFATHFMALDQGIGVFWGTNGPLDINPKVARLFPEWLMTSWLQAEALPRQLPRTALTPPPISSSGLVEGEALQIVGITGGSVQYQRFETLSGNYQLWWSGAKSGNTLTLRCKINKPGRYNLAGIFCVNRDYGSVNVKYNDGETQFNFSSDEIKWKRFIIGETYVTEDYLDIQFIATNNSGINDINCHLGIDYMTIRLVK